MSIASIVNIVSWRRSTKPTVRTPRTCTYANYGPTHYGPTYYGVPCGPLGHEPHELRQVLLRDRCAVLGVVLQRVRARGRGRGRGRGMVEVRVEVRVRVGVRVSFRIRVRKYSGPAA